MDRPNILWICTDQQRADALGCYGNPFVNQVHADRLAKEGVLFEGCYSQSPVCAPSRASFLTGRYPRTTRCRQNGQSIPRDEVLVTRLFAEAGYTCGLAGKLHVSASHPAAHPAGEPRINDGYHEFHWSHHPPAGWPTNEYHHWLREQGATFDRKPFPDSDYVQVGPAAAHHQTTWCAQKAINFIEANAQGDRPWLFSVNMFDPHHPFDPPADYLERYRPLIDDIPLPNYTPGELDHKPIWQQGDHRGAYGGAAGFAYDGMQAADHRWLRAAYWAMCDLIDDQVGRLLDALARTGQRQNTIVVFMSDHGEMLGDHGIYLKGPYFYEPAVRVPMLISWPGHLAQNRRSAALVELVDLAPTLLELAGLEVYPGMQGRSFAPLLAPGDAPAEHRDDIYCESYGANFNYTPAAYTTMVRTERYKLAVAHGQNSGELYDLKRDPHETYNLWHDPACGALRLEMQARLLDRMAWTCDPLPIREAPW